MRAGLVIGVAARAVPEPERRQRLLALVDEIERIAGFGGVWGRAKSRSMSVHRYDLRDLPEELLRPAVPPRPLFRVLSLRGRILGGPRPPALWLGPRVPSAAGERMLADSRALADSHSGMRPTTRRASHAPTLAYRPMPRQRGLSQPDRPSRPRSALAPQGWRGRLQSVALGEVLHIQTMQVGDRLTGCDGVRRMSAGRQRMRREGTTSWTLAWVRWGRHYARSRGFACHTGCGARNAATREPPDLLPAEGRRHGSSSRARHRAEPTHLRRSQSTPRAFSRSGSRLKTAARTNSPICRSRPILRTTPRSRFPGASGIRLTPEADAARDTRFLTSQIPFKIAPGSTVSGYVFTHRETGLKFVSVEIIRDQGRRDVPLHRPGLRAGVCDRARRPGSDLYRQGVA